MKTWRDTVEVPLTVSTCSDVICRKRIHLKSMTKKLKKILNLDVASIPPGWQKSHPKAKIFSLHRNLRWDII
jgi:hypothetical protein